MDIPSNTNINGKYVLNASQYGKLKEKGMINPLTANMSNASYGLEPVYVMKKQDFAVNHNNAIQGEGGLGSGESLEKRFPNASAEELKKRRYAQIKNAQRKYRSKPENRENYNAYMRKLYDTMAVEKKFIDETPSKRFGDIKPENKEKFGTYNTPAEWYAYRLKKARVANDLYRKKVRARKIMNNLDKIIEKELKVKFKEEKGQKRRGRPSKDREVFDPDSAWYKENFEKLKLEKQQELKDTGTIMPYKLRQKKTQPEYPLGIYKTDKDGVNVLVEAFDDKPIDDRKEYDADASAYKKKREKPKAPPVVSEKKKKEASPFTPKEPVKEVKIEDTTDFQEWFRNRFGAERFVKGKKVRETFEEALSTQGIKGEKEKKDKALYKYIELYKNTLSKPFAPKENITFTISEK